MESLKQSAENAKNRFEELYERYYAAVKAYFVRRYDPNEAEDLAQQTFMQLWAWLPCGHVIKDEKSLVFTIAKRVLCDRLRRKTKAETEEAVCEIFDIPDDTDFTSEIEFKILLRTLAETDRMMIDLKSRGLKSREIGDILGISASAVRTRFQNIKRSVKKLIDN